MLQNLVELQSGIDGIVTFKPIDMNKAQKTIYIEKESTQRKNIPFPRNLL